MSPFVLQGKCTAAQHSGLLRVIVTGCMAHSFHFFSLKKTIELLSFFFMSTPGPPRLQWVPKVREDSTRPTLDMQL